MSDQYLSEIRIMAFGYAPQGWVQCNGQILPINQNAALFALIGNTYGGDGRSNFALPNLQDKVPIHVGDAHPRGEHGGQPTHTLMIGELPQHTHNIGATATAADAGLPGRTPDNTKILAEAHAASGGAQPANLYFVGGANQTFDASTIGPAGGSQPHDNTQPYLTLNFCIALQGVFPSQN